LFFSLPYILPFLNSPSPADGEIKGKGKRRAAGGCVRGGWEERERRVRWGWEEGEKRARGGWEEGERRVRGGWV